MKERKQKRFCFEAESSKGSKACESTESAKSTKSA